MEGDGLVGYLKWLGAETDEVANYFLYKNNPDFEIVEKICRLLLDATWRQRRGLEQRGVSNRNVTFARRFVTALLNANLIQLRGGSTDVVGVTSAGREAIARVAEQKGVSSEILDDFLARELAPR